jgi:2,3-diphosphopglycerate-independent phosphoglycerate mutase
MGAGVEMAHGDIAFKCNFATLDPETGIVISRRADRHFEEEGPALCAALDGLHVPGYPQHSVMVKYATEHRCGVVVRGPRLTDAISGTDPLKDNLPLQPAAPLDDSQEALLTAAVINAASALFHTILLHHPINQARVAAGKAPANVVLLRGCGIRLALTPFVELHSGLRPAIIAPTKIIAGLGMCASMDVLIVPGTTGDYRSLFHRKAEAAAGALTTGGYDFVFLHVKAVDDAGHDRSLDLKLGYLEVVDRMVGQLLRLLWHAERDGSGPYAVVVTGDHSTPVEFGDHSHEPVPFAVTSVRDALEAAGGEAAFHERVPLGPIPHPQREYMRFPQGTPLSVETNGAEHRDVDGAGRALRGDRVRKFSEIDAAEGTLGRFPGSQVMNIVKDFAGV